MIAHDRLERGRERIRVGDRHDRAAVEAHQFGNRAGHGAHHRDAAGERLGDGHAVAFVAGRQHEHVGLLERLLELRVVELAGQRDAVDDAGDVDLLTQCSDVIGRQRVAADARQVPREQPQLGDRVEQHVVALARNQAAHAQQFHRRRPLGAGAAATALGARSRIGARRHDRDRLAGHSARGDGAADAEAGRQQAGGGAERLPFTLGHHGGRLGIEAGFVGQQVVHEAHHREPVRHPFDLFRCRAQHQPVHQHHGAVAMAGEHAVDPVQRVLRRVGKAPVHHRDVDLPAEGAQALHDLAIVAVPSRATRQAAGHEQRERAGGASRFQ